MTLKEIDALVLKINTAEHLSEKQLFDFAYKANEEGKCYRIAIKITNAYYKRWYDESVSKFPQIYQEPLEFETLYITTTDNKAFKSGMGGYSIFAKSIASMIRETRGMTQHDIDRIERAPVEYGVILEELK